jgi:Protein of unknown function (DUF1579)
MTSHIWQFEGTFDGTGNILTWETEGPVPNPQTPSRFREVTELKSPDHKVFTSSNLEPDGSWNTLHDHQYPAKEVVARYRNSGRSERIAALQFFPLGLKLSLPVRLFP